VETSEKHVLGTGIIGCKSTFTCLILGGLDPRINYVMVRW